MVRKLLTGARSPGLDLAFTIETKTGGLIRARDWTLAASDTAATGTEG